MPNWCGNTLVVTGPDTDVEAFVTATSNKAGSLQFERLVPVPRGTKEQIESGEWDQIMVQVAAWGTKWDVTSDDNDASATPTILEPGAVVWEFVTAWSPPNAWLHTVAPQFPTLDFELTYDEPGNAFCGYQVWEHGTLAEERERDWSSTTVCAVATCDEYIYVGLPWDLDEGDTGVWYCDDHRLEEAVQQVTQEGAR